MTQNPYRFDPIKDEKLLAGRDDELNKAKTYLESQYNLFVCGPRGSGKSSFLNALKIISNNKNVLIVSIDLKETGTEDNIEFYKKIFDYIMVSGVDKNMFGGRSAEFYNFFRDFIDNLNTNVELNFYIAKIYLSKINGNSPQVSLPELKNDFKALSYEAQQKNINSVILIFDDCEKLAKNEQLINTINSIFDSEMGYRCIFSGNEHLVQLFNESGTVIPIKLRDFKTEKEIKNFLLHPLTDNERNLVDKNAFKIILNFSQGSASARILTLFGHHMYNNYQEQKTSTITVSYDVVCDVYEQLEGLVIDSTKKSEVKGLIDGYLKIYKDLYEGGV